MDTCMPDEVCQSSLTTQVEDNMIVSHIIRRGCSAPIDGISDGTKNLLLSVNSNTTSCNYENTCDGLDCSDGIDCLKPFKNKALQCDEHIVDGIDIFAGTCLPADGDEDWTISDVNCFECFETLTEPGDPKYDVRTGYDKCLNYAWAEGVVITCRHRCAKTLTDTVEMILSNPTNEIKSQYTERTVERGCLQSYEQSSTYNSTTRIYQCVTNNCNQIHFSEIPNFCIPIATTIASTVTSTAKTTSTMTPTTLSTISTTTAVSTSITSTYTWSPVAVAGLTIGCCIVLLLITFFVIAMISPYGLDWLCTACGIASEDPVLCQNPVYKSQSSSLHNTLSTRVVEPYMQPTQISNGRAPARRYNERPYLPKSKVEHAEYQC